MKATIRLTIDLEAKGERRFFFFHRKLYAKATFEGEIELGDIRVGETLMLKVFNDTPTKFIVRSIERTPVPGSFEVKNFIHLYERTESPHLTSAGFCYQTIAECVHRLETSIAESLAVYGLTIDRTKSGVGPEPTYTYIPSNVGSTSLSIALYSFNQH